MISPSDIKDQCLKWWKDVLLSHISGQSLFPKEIIRMGKISSKDVLKRLNIYRDEINALTAKIDR